MTNSGLAYALSMINGGFFLKPSSLRKVDRRRFCGETEGVLLCLARFPRQTEPAAKAAGEPTVNSPSPRFAGSSLGEGAKIFGKSQFIVYPVEAKPLFFFFPTKGKS